MNKKEWEELKKKEKLPKKVAEILRVEEKDFPRVLDRFPKESEEMNRRH